MQTKNPMKALLLSFIPGLGHFYLNRKGRAFLYGAGFFGPICLLFLLGIAGELRHAEDFAVMLLIVALLSALINMIDMVVGLIKGHSPAISADISSYQQPAGEVPFASHSHDSERSATILLSLIPGLGHLHLSLMQRGLTFLITFFGSMVMIIFVSVLTHQGGFMVFLGVLPIIWLYCMFDCVQQLNRKERGEPLVDQTIFEDFQESRDSGKKNKMIATLLSVFPGAGHMYLGLQKRGLQLMASFLFCLYIMDVLRLSFFLFLIPILWFYSFFDALQHISKQEREELKDTPFVDWLVNHQKWIGIALLALGVYYLLDEVVLQALDRLYPNERISSLFHQYFQTFIVSVLLIGGGIRLLFGNNSKKG